MRRVSAILLLVLFSLPLTSPLFADADSKLPACCRRAGKHGCALQEPSSGLAVKDRSTCPNYPKADAVPAHSKIILRRGFEKISALAPADPAIRKLAEANPPISFVRSHHKRGPPILFA